MNRGRAITTGLLLFVIAALIGLGLLMTGATLAYTSRRRHNA